MKYFRITVKHDYGKRTFIITSETEEKAKQGVIELEKCPECAIVKIQSADMLYRVIKIMRVSGRRQILERNLTESEAQRVVKRYPNINRSMVIYTKEKPKF